MGLKIKMNNLTNYQINIEDFNSFILNLEKDIKMMENQVRKIKFYFIILTNNEIFKNKFDKNIIDLFLSSYVKLDKIYEKILEIKKFIHEKENKKISKEAKNVLKNFYSLKQEFRDLRNLIWLISKQQI